MNRLPIEIVKFRMRRAGCWSWLIWRATRQQAGHYAHGYVFGRWVFVGIERRRTPGFITVYLTWNFGVHPTQGELP